MVAQATVYQFGEFALDTHQGVVQRGGRSIDLRPKAYALLSYLAQNGGRVVPKAELMDAVWPDIYVTEDSLTQTIREIRKVLDDGDQALVRTIHRRGYMLAGQPDEGASRDTQPIVAVLRFRNDSGDPDDESLVEGIADDIINGLARFGTVTVLARNSSFAFSSYSEAGWAAAAAQVGAGYIVEGSVHRRGSNATIAVNLIDAAHSVQLWGDRYEAEDVSLFSVQEEIGVQIVSRLVAQLDEDGSHRVSVKPPSDLRSYELVARGRAGLRSYRLSDAIQAQTHFEQAVASDPNYGLAYGLLSLTRIVVGGLDRGAQDVYDDALELATRAISLSPEQAMGHRAMALAQLGRRHHDSAEAALIRALQINRYDADTLAQMGYLQTLRGRPADGLTWHTRALRLNPIHPFWYDHDRALALYQLAEYREAAQALEKSPTLPPWIRTRLAACYAQLGDEAAARRNALLIEVADPPFSPLAYVAGLPFEYPADRDHFEEGVKAALRLL